ncbi:LUD domain-containing protein [Desulfothermobacter acidiphilus]|uniref:LUD domain-containing protein n=1 Tax=Desulfothermobacter acidiphilus TaxID=1938353 RepID=UPI003F8A4D15
MSLRKEVDKALANRRVSWALTRFADSYVPARERAYAGRDFLALRQQVAEIKAESIARMEELAEAFTREATRRGAVVFRAAGASEARAYIAELARSRGITTVVKSKSMASEEIHLNSYLQAQGLDVVETDLGEWIIQLSGQRPSHLVMPAIHMSRQEVAELFSRQAGQELEPEVAQLVQFARAQLRQKFLGAWMGVSGANLAVAETGTVVILTNEGNGRLTTTLPPVHVVVVGLEKLVPRLADIVPVLEVLPRSATAQNLTSYVTLITGTVPAEDPEGNYHLQKELHIVLLDNGRSRMAADPVFREALRCVRCAACLNVCPVYQQVGGFSVRFTPAV